eukprot:281379-Prymnesium_polylepis.1
MVPDVVPPAISGMCKLPSSMLSCISCCGPMYHTGWAMAGEWEAWVLQAVEALHARSTRAHSTWRQRRETRDAGRVRVGCCAELAARLRQRDPPSDEPHAVTEHLMRQRDCPQS